MGKINEEKRKDIERAMEMFDEIEERVREIVKLTSTSKNKSLEKIVGMNEDGISIEVDDYCYGESNYDYDWIPVEYLFMDDDEIIQKDKERKEELKRIEEAEEERKRKEEELKFEQQERATYERLKKKFEQ